MIKIGTKITPNYNNTRLSVGALGGLWALVWWGLALQAHGQNLIPNPSFEEKNDCPEYLGSVQGFGLQRPEGALRSWVANPPESTPDYYHPCGKSKFRVPKNLCGTLEAHHGEAYMGMIVRIGTTYSYSMESLLYREHITAKLVQPLAEGKAYQLRIFIAQSDYSNYACANFGAYFTETPQHIKSNKTYEPQLRWPELLVCQGKWIELVDTLIAQGGETFITIGNFDSFNQRKMKRIYQNPKHRKKFSYHRAYYYVDNLSLIEVPLPKLPAPAPSTLLPAIKDPYFGKIDWGTSIILERVFFEFDQAQLLPESFPNLNELGRLLHLYEEAEVKVIGHTDSIGTWEDNLDLSLRRAESVKNYLSQQGISPSRIHAEGKGESQALEDNGDSQGRQRNRRVEFVLIASPY